MAEPTQPRTVTVDAGKYQIEKEVKGDSVSRETFTVQADTSIDEVYKKDQAGYFLSWEIEPGQFRSLTEGEYRKLSSPSRTAYNAMARAATVEIERANSEFKDLPRVIAPHQTGDAGRKLALNQAIPGRTVGWKRPDELHQAENRGWRKIKEADGYTPNFGTQSASDGIYIKTKDGKDVDLVAMDIDSRLHKSHIDTAAYRSQNRTKDQRTKVKDEAKEAGINVFDVDPDSVDTVGAGGETPGSAQRRAASRAASAERSRK